MAQIATTTNTTPFIYPSTTLFDRDPQTGYLYAMVKASTADNYTVYRSTNAGASWASYVTLVRTGIAEIGPIAIHNQKRLHWTYRTNESSQDRIYYRRLNLETATWSSEVLLTAVANGGTAGTIYQGMDHQWVEFYSPAQYGLVAVGFTSGASHGVKLFGVYTPGVSGTGTPTSNDSIITGTRQWILTGSGRITPSVDVEHISDGRTSNGINPHMWVAWGRAKARLVKVAWTGNGWQGPASPIVLSDSIGTRDYLAARWDGSQFIVALPNTATGLTDTVIVYERNRANTTTIERVSGVHPTGVARHVTCNYNAVTGDIRVFAVGTSTDVLYYTDFIRASSTWSGWSQVTATAILGVNNYGVRRSSAGNAKHDVYTAHSGAPNTLVHAAQTLTYAPFAPTWQNVEQGVAADVNAVLDLDWAFSDPDPSDAQTAYALSRQIGAGALSYWRASDSTWQVAEVKNTSGVTFVQLASGWAAGTDAAYTFRSKVWDGADTASVYGSGLVFTPSVKVNPTVTQPLDSSTWVTDTLTVTWTVSEQTAYRVKLIIFSELLHDSGWIAGGALSYVVPTVLVNGFSYSVQVQTQNNEGLKSNVVQTNFSVAFTAPAQPTLAFSPNATNGYITVTITDPTPTGGQPQVSYHDLYRRVVGDSSNGIRVGTGIPEDGSFNDWRAVSGVAYEYRTLTVAVNGASTNSAWTS